LAIGLASNVLQSQLRVLSGALGGAGCSELTGGGSARTLKRTEQSNRVTDATVRIYYDDACKTPYMTSTATVTETGSGADLKALVVYQAPNGAVLGTMTTAARAISQGALFLVGTGTFVASHTGVPDVHLGLACALQTGVSSTIKPFPCAGGVAQYFPSLGESLGSISPLTVSVGGTSANPGAVSFAGSASTLAVGTKTMSIGTGTSYNLVLTGGARKVGTESTTGHAGAFSLFPPTPTGWTATDRTGGQKFHIAVVDNTSRKLQGSVVATATGAILATVQVDRSGTGTIRYAGATGTNPVLSWTVTG
jgi:hypothetical protein